MNILSKLKKINFLFMFLIIILSTIGFLALYSAGNGSLTPWAGKHTLRFIIFVFLLVIVSLVDIRFWHKHTYTIFFICLLLLISVQFAGYTGLGAKRWIKIFGISLQPSELIKVALILALSKYYHDLKYESVKKIKNIIIPLILIFIPFIFILFQPDLGTSLMILILGISMMFVSGVRIWKFILSFVVLLVSMPFIWNYIKPYQKSRILSFLNPESDPLGTGYHLIQSKIALGSGGFFGKGFLQGTQSYLEFLPEKQTDFIFTTIGEEFGFIGTSFILIIFLLLIILCFIFSFNSKNVYGKILAAGVSINLFLYVILNTSMVTGLLPIVGVPLPLLSYGGTAMLSIMLSFGFLMNIQVYNNINISE